MSTYQFTGRCAINLRSAPDLQWKSGGLPCPVRGYLTPLDALL